MYIYIYVGIFHTCIRTAVGDRFQNLMQIDLNSGVVLNLTSLDPILLLEGVGLRVGGRCRWLKLGNFSSPQFGDRQEKDLIVLNNRSLCW